MELIKFVMKVMEKIEEESQKSGEDARDTFFHNVGIECAVCPLREECRQNEDDRGCQEFLKSQLTV